MNLFRLEASRTSVICSLRIVRFFNGTTLAFPLIKVACPSLHRYAQVPYALLLASLKIWRSASVFMVAALGIFVLLINLNCLRAGSLLDRIHPLGFDPMIFSVSVWLCKNILDLIT